MEEARLHRLSPVFRRRGVLVGHPRVVQLGASLNVGCVSSLGGTSEREIIPCALADKGLRWHAPAFGRNSFSLKDFTLNLVITAGQAEGTAGLAEGSASDAECSKLVDLELWAYPHSEWPELATQNDPMVDGKLGVVARAPLAGHARRWWNVDCSLDHFLRGPGCRPWLRDPLAFSGVESASIAAGYVLPKELAERG